MSSCYGVFLLDGCSAPSVLFVKLIPRTIDLILDSDRFRFRLIRAERISSKRIARVSKCPGTRSSADVAVLALPALSMETVGCMERAEDFGVAINVHERIHPHVAAAQWQES